MLPGARHQAVLYVCLLYTSDAADDGESVDLGGRRIIKKKKKKCFFFFSFFLSFFFFQAEDGIRDQPRSRGLGDVYKRQVVVSSPVRRLVW